MYHIYIPVSYHIYNYDAAPTEVRSSKSQNPSFLSLWSRAAIDQCLLSGGFLAKAVNVHCCLEKTCSQSSIYSSSIHEWHSCKFTFTAKTHFRYILHTCKAVKKKWWDVGLLLGFTASSTWTGGLLHNQVAPIYLSARFTLLSYSAAGYRTRCLWTPLSTAHSAFNFIFTAVHAVWVLA